MAQTWHQVRPGEMRADCGGCHAHSQAPLRFEDTAAAQPGYVVADLTATTPLVTHDAQGQPAIRVVPSSVVNVEFYRDVRPLLQRSCVPCHTKTSPAPPGALVLDDLTLYEDGLPGDYLRLASDGDARWGYPPLVTVGHPVWRQTNASRYVRVFQSRRSLLVWKIFGARLDGWTNADHPTESTPGNASTLPAGAGVNEADLDFTGSIMPPPGSGVPPLSIDERMTIARWIDLGAPIDAAQSAYGWFLDDLRPTLTVSEPRPGANVAPVDAIVIGAVDADSGIDAATLSVTADIPLGGHDPGTELAGDAVPAGDGIYRIALGTPLDATLRTHLHVSIADRQGNVTRVDRAFSVAPDTGPSRTPTPAQRTATRTPTPQPTATPVAVHDSAILPIRRPIRIRIPRGADSRTARVRVTVRNADAPGPSEAQGHVIQLVTDPGTCPPDLIATLPDFDHRTGGAQDTAVVPPRRRKRAQLTLRARAADFDTAATAATCHLRLIALGPGTDPTPTDDVVDVEVQVEDTNDAR
jgi:hypothetical protein